MRAESWRARLSDLIRDYGTLERTGPQAEAIRLRLILLELLTLPCRLSYQITEAGRAALATAE